jgi:hypothetical protein
MTSGDIFEEYRMLCAAEEYDRAKKHLVDEWRDDDVIVDPEFDQYKQSLGFGDG